MKVDGPYFQKAFNWWKTRLSSAPLATILPFRRLIRHRRLDPSEGILQWTLKEQTAQCLDDIAHSFGTTHFVLRLAAFSALLADITGNLTVVIGTTFDGRDRIETRNIVGRFAHNAPLVVRYDASKTFLEWLQIVRDGLFETKEVLGGLPYGVLVPQLLATGVQPFTQIVFMQSSDHSDQRFGGLAVCSEKSSVGVMPNGCTFYVDQQKSENCYVQFDPGLYDRKGMRMMMDRYIRLLEAIAREPQLPIGKLQATIGTKPLRWAWSRYAMAICEFIRPYYGSSPLLKNCWCYAKKRFGTSE
jgi:hypothetical protein